MCPACKQPLVAFELEGIEIDRCVDCGGIWLDAGELEQIAERAGASPGPLARALREAKGKRSGERRCPRCRRKLRVVEVAVNPPIELDHCPHGDGLWFDRGEIQALVSRCADADSEEQAAVAAFFSDFFGGRKVR